MTIAELIAEIMANVTANGNRENTGARVQALLIEMAQFSDKVNFFDTYADFPAVGQDEMLYVTKDANVVYRYDTALNTYVLLNDPDVVNPDAPEEGQTFYVRLATSAALNACTYNNGTGGVGATLTGNANGLLSQSNQVGKIDNITPVVNDVLLIKNQATALQNGIYEVTQAGDVSNPFILTRIDGYDETSEVYPSVVFVSLGQNNANKYFTQSTANPVIGTSSLVFSVSTTSTQALPILFFDTVTQGPLDAFDANPATYTSGTAYPATLPGYGATLRGNVNGALGTINGVPMVSGSRIIVKDEANAAYNGTYTVTNAGSATQRWTLTRWVSDSGLFYRTRTFVVNNPNCNDYGSSWSVSSPLSMSNANYGTTPIVFSRINKLSNILSNTADDMSDRMLDTQRIYSEDALGELKMGWDYGTGLESYLYRAQDGGGEARVGLYTDQKGVVVWDSPNALNDYLTLYANNGARINISTGIVPFSNAGDVQLHSEIGDIKIQSTAGKVDALAISGSDQARITLDPGNYNAFRTNGSSIFISIDDVSFQNSNLLLQNNSAALRCYSASGVVEVTTGSATQGLVLSRQDTQVNLFNNEGLIRLSSDYEIILTDTADTNYIKVDTPNDLISIFSEGSVRITADNGQTDMYGRVFAHGGIYLADYSTMYGGDGNFTQNLSRAKVYLGNAGDDDFSWYVGNDNNSLSYIQSDGAGNTTLGWSDGTVSMNSSGVSINTNNGDFLITAPTLYVEIDGGTHFLDMGYNANVARLRSTSAAELSYTGGGETVFFGAASGGASVYSTLGVSIDGNGVHIKLSNLPTYANDAAAGLGGVPQDGVYKTATGELRIKL